ncbi:hypothetical protein [Haloarchaeobius sp. HME9146]|uniref:hypothetical protein n=1 Tax=Haloarchaeobius sp. HME9146 TaxID=2978732 RepID=UPI0021BE0242|nr:hypothetical protein [Haloarchaeobius sp. HME9146]MCT9097200.1 hypothetical protein [Haloarchaeobius sp. HME9146]
MADTPFTSDGTTEDGSDEEGSFPMHRRELLLSGASYATIGIAGPETHLVSLAQVRRAARAARSKEAAEAVVRSARVKGNPVAAAAASNAVSSAVLDKRKEAAEALEEGVDSEPDDAATAGEETTGEETTDEETTDVAGEAKAETGADTDSEGETDHDTADEQSAPDDPAE